MMWIQLANVLRYSTLTTHGLEALDAAPRSQKLWRWKFINSGKISPDPYLDHAALHSSNKKRVMI